MLIKQEYIYIYINEQQEYVRWCSKQESVKWCSWIVKYSFFRLFALFFTHISTMVVGMSML